MPMLLFESKLGVGWKIEVSSAFKEKRSKTRKMALQVVSLAMKRREVSSLPRVYHFKGTKFDHFAEK